MATLLVDGDNLLTIGFYGLKDYYHEDKHIGGLYHFINTLRKSFDQFRLNKICVFWDGEDSSHYRKQIYYPYKDNRKTKTKSEDEILSYNQQRNRIKQYLEELYVRQCEFEQCESDDCIAYYCKNSPMEEKIIYSSDGDLLQLITHNTKVYNPSHKQLYSKNSLYNFKGESVLIENVKLLKIIIGDNSDNIFGIKGVGLNKLLKIYPKILNEEVTLSQFKNDISLLLEKDKENKIIKNILTGETKLGIFGEEFFLINEKIIDLNYIYLTQEAREGIIDIIFEKLDTNGRSYKNVMKMMMDDGFFNYLPKYNDSWVSFLNPLLQLTRIEKNKKIN